MRKIKSFRLIGFIIALAIIFSSLSVFGSTVAFAAEDSTSYSGEEFVESKEFSNAANGETLQSAFSNKTVREGLCSIGRTKTKSGRAETDKSKLNRK